MTCDVDVVVGWYDVDARLHTVLAWNVGLDLEADSPLTRVSQPQFRRLHVCVRTYNAVQQQQQQLRLVAGLA